MNEKAVFSCAYFAPVHYLKECAQHSVIYIERHENYIKQSFRNRAEIGAANEIQRLVIPVVKNHGEKIKIIDVRIDYSTRWQHLHTTAILSAYKNSPYFDYYWYDHILPLLSRKCTFLYELNMQTLQTLFRLMKLRITIEETSEFIEPNATSIDDFRYSISPKAKPNIQLQPYHQVFEERHGFVPYLSGLDLLFNMGPESAKWLVD